MYAKLTIVLLIAGAAGLGAQGQPPRQPPVAGGDSMRPNATRADLEQRVRERMAEVTKDRLGASDEQMAKLQETSKKFDDMRRTLVEQEKEVRVSLRQEMQHPDPARQGQAGTLLDRLIKIQRQRVDIQEQEQKEIAGYLTPLQRAKYFALEQQIRQRVTQMRQMETGRGGRVGRGKPLPVRPPGAGRAGRGVQPPRPRQ